LETKVVGDPILAILRFLGGLAKHVFLLAKHGLLLIPVVVFLASVTLVMENFHTFRAFDDKVLAGVMSTRGPADIEKEPGPFTAAIISRELFTTDLERRLPFNKEKLAGALQLLAAERPKVIAVDVDAIPRGIKPTDDVTDVKDVQPQEMFKAIKPLLQAGIAVVLVSYPGVATEEADAYRWRMKFCEAAKMLPPQPQPLGRLWWASTYLEAEGSTLSVLRYHSLTQMDAVKRADGSLIPLGHVLAVASGLLHLDQQTLVRQADYCAKPPMAPTSAADLAQPRKAPDPDNFINYFSEVPTSFQIGPNKKIPMGLPLKGKAVVLGVQSFEGVDEHSTPVGRLAGALMHAFVASSLLQPPLAETHRGPFAVDVIMGYAFVLLFHGLQDFRNWLSSLWPRANALRRLASILMPMIAGMTTAGLLIWLGPVAATEGLWLNPLPMLLGLTAHLYLELIPGGRRAHSIDGALRRWKRRTLVTPRNWIRLPRLKSDLRAEVIVWTLVQGVMLFFLCWAFYILIRNH
jgi:hypothetical protein